MSSFSESSVSELIREPLVASKGAPAWFAIQTWPRYEKKVAGVLQRKDLTVFLPLHSTERQWSDRRRVIQSPLFPGYVFVQICEEASTRTSILRTIGVTGLVGARGNGTPIPDPEIDSVRQIVANVPFELRAFLNVGKRIRLRGGSLDGVEGILARVNEDDTLVVSVELISRSLAIRVAGYRIEPV